jgi:25S rRNA (adenine2142-N1)-methyltransferase
VKLQNLTQNDQPINMAKSKPRVKPKSKPTPSKPITSGRPPLSKPEQPTLSSKATRTLIRTHHTLLKAHASALSSNDTAKAATIAAEITASGGLESYQLASTLGQSLSRGGDSSRILVSWLQPAFATAQANGTRLRMLEVGALSVSNACSRVPCLDIDRIDLHSQMPGIREIDFMELSPPATEDEKYHLVSLSLVLNFVPEASARGEMLRRIPKFLRRATDVAGGFPSYLFFVLPLPCVENARYMDQAKLGAIMESLGFTNAFVKKTAKLYYSLWRYDEERKEEQTFAKKELRAGGKRNNFAIVLR